MNVEVRVQIIPTSLFVALILSKPILLYSNIVKANSEYLLFIDLAFSISTYDKLPYESYNDIHIPTYAKFSTKETFYIKKFQTYFA